MRYLLSLFVSLCLVAAASAGLDVPPQAVDTSQFVTSSQLSSYAPSSVLNGYVPTSALPFDTNGKPLGMAAGRLPSIIYVLTNNVVSNATTDTNCFGGGVGPGASIPAGVAYPGNTFRLLCRGAYSTGIANVSAATIKIKVGSTTAISATTAALPISLSGYQFLVDVTCTVRSVATPTAATMVCTGESRFWTVANAVSLAAPPSIQLTSGTTPFTFDSTVSASLQITSALTSLTGSPSITATYGTVEILF